MVGGAPAPDDRAVLDIAVRGRVLCSGVLIAPDLVLTAAHCLPQPGGVATIEDVTAGGARVASTRIHPSYDPVSGADDVAVARLEEDVEGVTPLGWSREALSAQARGAEVRIVGFGEPQPGLRYSGTARVGAIGERDFALEAGPSLPCTGDSGGPVLLGGEVVGLVVAGDATCSAARALQVGPYRSFIEDPPGGCAAGGIAAPWPVLIAMAFAWISTRGRGGRRGTPPRASPPATADRRRSSST